MNYEQQAEIARLMTGSTLSTEKIKDGVINFNSSIKITVCKKINELVKAHDMPFDKGFSLIKNDFNHVAMENNVDPAVLFWVFMEWLKENQ